MAVDIKNDSTLSTNLISAWLSDSSTLTQDLKGTNTLTNNGTATSTTGKQGTAVELNGSTQYLSRADNTELSPSGSFSFAFWFNADGTGDLKPIISKWDEGGAQRSMAVTFNGNKLRWLLSSDGSGLTVDITGATTISTSTWYHCAVVFSSSTKAELFLNAASDGTDTTGIPSAMYDSTASFKIGQASAFGGSTHYFDGRVNQVCFWNKVLTSGEITSLYNSGTGIPYESAGGGGAYIPKIMMS